MSQLRNSPGISTGFLRQGRSRILTNKAIAYESGGDDVLAALNKATGCPACPACRDAALVPAALTWKLFSTRNFRTCYTCFSSAY